MRWLILAIFSLSCSGSYAAKLIFGSKSLLVLRADDDDNFASYAFPKLKFIIQSCNGNWKDWVTQSEKGRDCEPRGGPNKLSWIKDLASSCERIYASEETGWITITDKLTCGVADFSLNLENGYEIRATNPQDTKLTYEIEFVKRDAYAFGNSIALIGATITDQNNERIVELKEYGSCRISSTYDVNTLNCVATFR